MNTPRTPQPDEEDHDLQAILGSAQLDTSAKHDQRILSAARAMTQTLRDEKAARRTVHAQLRHWQLPVSLAAAALLGAVALFWLVDTGRPVDDQLRGAEHGALVSPAPGAQLGIIPTELRWGAVAGASAYRVTLRDSSAQVLWTGEAAEPHVDIPAGALHRPGAYIWSVAVEGPSVRQDLGPYSFEIGR